MDELNRDKQAVFEQLIDEQMSDGEVAAFMVWGDPSLYDSSIRIIESIASARSDLSYDVIPGITSLQALTARHRIPLNQIGRAVEITTGRLLAEGWPQGVDSVAVMLDAKDTYLRFVGQGLHIYWGAYVGTADEILIAGPLDEVAERIAATRAEARERNGWIMDSDLSRTNQREIPVTRKGLLSANTRMTGPDPDGEEQAFISSPAIQSYLSHVPFSCRWSPHACNDCPTPPHRRRPAAG